MDAPHWEFQKLETPESLKLVRAIADEVWPNTFRAILSPEQIAYMMKMMYAPEVMNRELASGVRFELLRIDGAPAGYLIWSAYEGHCGTAKLHKVYLLERYHFQGYGKRMLARAAEEARAAGFSRLLLTVNKHNEKAIAAYLRNGFVRTESVKTDIGNGFFMDDFIMVKDLAE